MSQIDKEIGKSYLEFSKRLALYDVIIYVVLTITLIVLMVVCRDLAEYCINGMTALSTVYVALRSGYTLKAGIENYNKIKTTLFNSDEKNSSEDDENG